MSIFAYLKHVFEYTGFHTSRKSAFLGSFLILTLSVSLLPVSAQAVSFYHGEQEARSHQKITLKPGGAITFTIKFKNKGNATWRSSGSNFVAVATIPNLRKSQYAHSFWEEPYRAGRLIESQVAPGETGTFRFALQAPSEEGDYTEFFQLVARNAAWVEGTKFAIEITSGTPEVADATDVGARLIAPLRQDAAPVKISAPLKVDYPVKDAGYKASWVAGDQQEFAFNPGEQKLLTFEVKNIGNKTWENTGGQYASVYTVRPNYHDSAFFTNGPGWLDNSQIRLASTQVAPGETGKITVMLQAPKTAGTYTDSFRLALENYSWISSGELAITIKVADSIRVYQKIETKKQEIIKTSINNTVYKDTDYQASFITQSQKNISINSGESLSFQVGFKNSGSKSWNKSGSRYISLYTIEPNYRASRFSSAAGTGGWISRSQVQLFENKVTPGQIGYFKFNLTAPTTPGVYIEKFRLAAEDWSWVQGGEFELSITVKGNAPAINNNPSNITQPESTLGPLMRVGLYSSENEFILTADSPFEVRTGSGVLLGSLPARSPVSVIYNTNTNFYKINAIGIDRSISEHVIIQALDNQTITEILSLEKRVPWNQAINENLFRGSVEIRHSAKTGKTWAINVLPMEHYLRGIAETSSASPVEFLKVMSVAARTYATYHYERQTKHANENFYVDSQYDQVYRGYSLEQRHPSLKEAVIGTAGEVITYTNPATAETKLAITPYFSQSDGRTRSWSEVWGGDVAWCKSVSVPHDIGRPLLGHGVGMSARGGLLMVIDDGLNYQQVLKYFFSGILIDDRY